MKKLFYVLFFVTNFLSAQVNDFQVKDFKQIQDTLVDKINKLEMNLIEFENTSDSLKQEILFYKVKEDYYSTALSDQSNRFALIVSGILGIFAIISFGVFKYEYHRIKNENDIKFKEHSKKFKKHQKRLYKTKTDIMKERGNLSVTIGLMHKKEKRYMAAFFYYIRGASDRIYSKGNIKRNKNNKVLLINLNTVIEVMNKIGNSPQENKILLEQDTYVIKYLNKLSKSQDNEVINLVSEIRVKYNEMKKLCLTSVTSK